MSEEQGAWALPVLPLSIDFGLVTEEGQQDIESRYWEEVGDSGNAEKSYPAPHNGRPGERGGSAPRDGSGGETIGNAPGDRASTVDALAGGVAALADPQYQWVNTDVVPIRQRARREPHEPAIEKWFGTEEQFDFSLSNLEAAERRMSALPQENSILYDYKGDFFRKEESESEEELVFPYEQGELEGCIYTHNHPNDSFFSPDDIENALATGLIELRAVTKEGTFVFHNRTSWESYTEDTYGDPAPLYGILNYEASVATGEMREKYRNLSSRPPNEQVQQEYFRLIQEKYSQAMTEYGIDFDFSFEPWTEPATKAYQEEAGDSGNAEKSFDAAKHPRHPAGTKVDPETGAGGGRFAPKSGESSADTGGYRDARGNPVEPKVKEIVADWKEGRKGGFDALIDLGRTGRTQGVDAWELVDHDTMADILVDAAGGDFKEVPYLWSDEAGMLNYPDLAPLELHQAIAGRFSKIDGDALHELWDMGQNLPAAKIVPYLLNVSEVGDFLQHYPMDKEGNRNFAKDLMKEADRVGRARVDTLNAKEDIKPNLGILPERGFSRNLPGNPGFLLEADIEQYIEDNTLPTVDDEEIASYIKLPAGYKMRPGDSEKMGIYNDVDGGVFDSDGNEVGQYGFTAGGEERPDDDLHIDLLSLNSSAEEHGIALSVLEGVVNYARDYGFSTISLEADITIGRYAWACYGFQYEDPDDAIYASDKFQDWAKERAIKEPEDGWPQFETPQDVISYDIPGVTIPGRHITNNDVAPDFKMNVGKAFMLDGYERSPYGGLISLGHGNWNAVIDVETLAKNLEKMRAKHSAKKGSAVKGGAGSGYFAPHSGRPGHRGGSAPRAAAPKPEEHGLGRLAAMIEMPAGFRQDVHYSASGAVTADLYDAAGELIGSYEITTEDDSGSIVLDHLEVERSAQQHGIALSVLEGVVKYAREHAYQAVQLQADITIGRYAWARYGFQYLYPSDAKSATANLKEWSRRRGISEPAGGWPTFKTPQDVISYEMPGVTIKGHDIDNADVAPDYEMSVGKAFMLDEQKTNAGHGDWFGIIGVDELDKSLQAMRAKHSKKVKVS